MSRAQHGIHEAQSEELAPLPALSRILLPPCKHGGLSPRLCERSRRGHARASRGACRGPFTQALWAAICREAGRQERCASDAHVHGAHCHRRRSAAPEVCPALLVSHLHAAQATIVSALMLPSCRRMVHRPTALHPSESSCSKPLKRVQLTRQSCSQLTQIWHAPKCCSHILHPSRAQTAFQKQILRQRLMNCSALTAAQKTCPALSPCVPRSPLRLQLN